jgi:hypothetical protein
MNVGYIKKERRKCTRGTVKLDTEGENRCRKTGNKMEGRTLLNTEHSVVHTP